MFCDILIYYKGGRDAGVRCVRTLIMCLLWFLSGGDLVRLRVIAACEHQGDTAGHITHTGTALVYSLSVTHLVNHKKSRKISNENIKPNLNINSTSSITCIIFHTWILIELSTRVSQSHTVIFVADRDRNHRYKIITNNNWRPEYWSLQLLCQTCIGDSVEMDLRRSLQGHRIAGVANEARLSGVTHKSEIFLEIKCFSKTEIFV